MSPSSGYALALTHSEAWIWSYNSPSSALSAKEITSFKLPFPPATSSDPLPLGVFTANSMSNEPGLVVVASDSGSVAYWEVISNASALLPGQVSSAIQGSVPGMMAGEIITEIVSAEPAGFILTFNHGRLAHLTVRDGLGRPSIGVRFLRRNGGLGGGGLFENLRQYVGVERRKPIVAARAGRSAKGQRDVIIATEDGEIEHWSTHLNFSDSLSYEVSTSATLSDALSHLRQINTKNGPGLKVIDFSLLERSNHENSIKTDPSFPYQLLLLASLTGPTSTTFYVIEGNLDPRAFAVTAVHPITSYVEADTVESKTKSRPRLCVPKPYDMAFIVFETAVAMYSLQKIEESPASQLLMEGARLPDRFQDCIKFQNDSLYRVLAVASEDKENSAHGLACVLAIQGFGVVRIASTLPTSSSEEPEEVKLSLKSKLEQAIFFGTMRQNPLDLSHTEVESYSPEEVEEAALSISHDILCSESRYIPKASPSLEQHLKIRGKALHDLSTHLIRHHRPLSRGLKWELLWRAERLVAAQAMWKVHEETMKRKPKDRKETYWDQLLFYMAPEYRVEADKGKGETDWVRLWLTKDVDRIEKLLNWLFEGHREVRKDRHLSENDSIENVRESCDLWVAAFAAAYRFREDNAPAYGLEDEIFDHRHNILKNGYSGLPEAWTHETKTVVNGERLLQMVIETTQSWWEVGPGKPRRKSVVHLAHAIPDQVDLYLRMFKERESWLTEQDSQKYPKYADMAKKMVKAGTIKQREYFYQIAGLGLIQQSIELAEKWVDMIALVELILEAKRQLQQQEDAGTSHGKQLEHEWKAIEERSESYFTKYGKAWASAHFNKMAAAGELGSLIAEAQTDELKRPFLTEYLRDEPGFQKISWISDVSCEGDYDGAADTLESLGTSKLNDAWAQKTELCLSKLARLAATEDSQSDALTQEQSQATQKIDDRLALLDIQASLHSHVEPALEGSIDVTAAQHIALETFGQKVVGDKYPALRGLLNDGFENLIRNHSLRPESLVDLLTLMDPVSGDPQLEEELGVVGHEFWLAMEAVRLGETDPSLADGLAHIIWRRAIIRDDWLQLNDTTDRNDQEVTATMTQSSLYRTLLDYFGYARRNPGKSLFVPLLSPQAIVNADVFPQSLRKRFHEAELELVQRDLEAENEVLKSYVEKGRLELHYGGLVKMAQEQSEAAADLAGEQILAQK